MKTFLLSIVIVFTCSVWAVGQNNRKLLPELLKEGSIDTYGLEKVSGGKTLHWTATRQGASVTFSSGETAWDFSPFVHLVLQSPNQKIPDRKTKCVIKTHINIKQNVIFSAKLKPV